MRRDLDHQHLDLSLLDPVNHSLGSAQFDWPDGARCDALSGGTAVVVANCEVGLEPQTIAGLEPAGTAARVGASTSG